MELQMLAVVICLLTISFRLGDITDRLRDIERTLKGIEKVTGQGSRRYDGID